MHDFPALAADEAARVSGKGVRKQVAAKLQRPHKSIKQDVEYAINQFMLERGGWADKESDAEAEAPPAAAGVHGRGEGWGLRTCVALHQRFTQWVGASACSLARIREAHGFCVTLYFLGSCKQLRHTQAPVLCRI